MFVFWAWILLVVSDYFFELAVCFYALLCLVRIDLVIKVDFTRLN